MKSVALVNASISKDTFVKNNETDSRKNISTLFSSLLDTNLPQSESETRNSSPMYVSDR